MSTNEKDEQSEQELDQDALEAASTAEPNSGTADIAAAALAAAKGSGAPSSTSERKQPATIVRRRRGATRPSSPPSPQDDAQLSVVRAPTLQEQGIDKGRSVGSVSRGNRTILEPLDQSRSTPRTRQPRFSDNEVRRTEPERKKRTPTVRPLPEANEQVSLVPPKVPETTAGLDDLVSRKSLLVSGGTPSARYRFCYETVGALSRDRLGRTKKRHELILDALREEEIFDVVALALFEAPRGLSLIALQTHELVLHYLRNKEPFTHSFRSVIQGVLSSPVTDGLFTTTSNGNWSLTEEGRGYVDENFRYALQAAAKEKPRRYSINDCALFLSSADGAFPALTELVSQEIDDFGCSRNIVRKGPLLKMIQNAVRAPKIPFAIVFLEATPQSLKSALGGLYPLIHLDNRGTGALAPTIFVPNVGTVSVPPNLHIICAMDDSVDASSLKSTDLVDTFAITTL